MVNIAGAWEFIRSGRLIRSTATSRSSTSMARVLRTGTSSAAPGFSVAVIVGLLLGRRSASGENGRALLLEGGQRLGHVLRPGQQCLAAVLQFNRRRVGGGLQVGLERALGELDAAG